MLLGAAIITPIQFTDSLSISIQRNGDSTVEVVYPPLPLRYLRLRPSHSLTSSPSLLQRKSQSFLSMSLSDLSLSLENSFLPSTMQSSSLSLSFSPSSSAAAPAPAPGSRLSLVSLPIAAPKTSASLRFCGLRREALGFSSLRKSGCGVSGRVHMVSRNRSPGRVSASASDNGTAPKSFDYDILIIGAGVGGHGAALHAVEKVILIAPVFGARLTNSSRFQQ